MKFNRSGMTLAEHLLTLALILSFCHHMLLFLQRLIVVTEVKKGLLKYLPVIEIAVSYLRENFELIISYLL